MTEQTIEYKGYRGTVEFSEEDNCLFGKIIGIKGLVSYEGKSMGDLEIDFHNAVDSYIESCIEFDITLEK